MSKQSKSWGATVLTILFAVTMVSAQSITLDSLQRRFVEKRFGMFIHFNMNTYSPGWGNPRVDPKLFNPTNLDCGQWARAAKAAGMKYGVLTCKHHDGFTIWPCKMTPLVSPAYTIAQSSQPKMDVVRAYVDSFRVYGLEPGLYMSGWDTAQHITQDIKRWTPAIRTFVLGQIHELCTNYGEIPIFMFDGYSWAMGHWAMPWQEIRDTIKALQPKCLVVETNGSMPEAWETDLNFFEDASPLNGFVPPNNTYASIQGQTISGGWFWNYTATTASGLKSVTAIVDNRLKVLEQRYCNFQLNCPPNKEGKLDAAMVTRLAEVGAAWKPNMARAPLPKQFPMIESPITPLSATATSGVAMNAIDGVNDWTGSAGGHFQTLWQTSGAFPQSVTIDLGKVYDNITYLFYLPSRLVGNTAGNITKYKIYAGTAASNLTEITTGTAIGGGTFGTWAGDSKIKRVQFAAQTAQFIKFEVLGVSSGNAAIVNELSVGGGPKTDVVNVNKAAVVPEKSFSACKSTMTATGHFDIPSSLTNHNTSVGVYTLAGKLLASRPVHKNSFDLQKDFGVPQGVYVVKVQNTIR